MQQIRLMKHDVCTVNLRKMVLSPYDNKQYVMLNNKITTLAYGQYKTVVENDEQIETAGAAAAGLPLSYLPFPEDVELIRSATQYADRRHSMPIEQANSKRFRLIGCRAGVDQ